MSAFCSIFALIFYSFPFLFPLSDKKERIVFADNIIKYERRYKPQPRVLLLGERTLYLIALEKAKEGPNKGKYVNVVKRKLGLEAISGISVSTLADDIFVIHVTGEYDNVFESVFKTELIVAIQQKSMEHLRRETPLVFSDQIQYALKKGKQVIKFVPDSVVRAPTMKNGVLKVPPGLPKDSRNIAPSRSLAQPAGRGPTRSAPQARPQQPAYQQPQPAYQQPAPPQPAYQQAPPQAAPVARPPMGMGRPPMMGMMARPAPQAAAAAAPVQRGADVAAAIGPRPGGARPVPGCV